MKEELQVGGAQGTGRWRVVKALEGLGHVAILGTRVIEAPLEEITTGSVEGWRKVVEGEEET